MKKLLGAVGFLVSLVFPAGVNQLQFCPKPLPVVDRSANFPDLSAQSALLVDVDLGMVIFQKNPHSRLNPASITKMVTAINALKTYPVDEVVTVKVAYPIGKNMGLQAKEKISIENLIYGLLVDSANDAAFVLAGQDQGKTKIFIDQMNQLVRRLGLTETHFVNFDGEDDQGHYSTAWDLSHLARWALGDSIFAEAVKTKEITVWDVEEKISHHLENTDELLGVAPEIKGIKTGWTPIAGECFLGLIQLKNHRLISVVLNSRERFGDTQRLINWSKKSIIWQNYSPIHSTETAGI